MSEGGQAGGDGQGRPPSAHRRGLSLTGGVREHLVGGELAFEHAHSKGLGLLLGMGGWQGVSGSGQGGVPRPTGPGLQEHTRWHVPPWPASPRQLRQRRLGSRACPEPPGESELELGGGSGHLSPTQAGHLGLPFPPLREPIAVQRAISGGGPGGLAGQGRVLVVSPARLSLTCAAPLA